MESNCRSPRESACLLASSSAGQFDRLTGSEGFRSSRQQSVTGDPGFQGLLRIELIMVVVTLTVTAYIVGSSGAAFHLFHPARGPSTVPASSCHEQNSPYLNGQEHDEGIDEFLFDMELDGVLDVDGWVTGDRVARGRGVSACLSDCVPVRLCYMPGCV